MQYYRKDVYDEHNLKPAETWDDLIHVSQKLTGGGHYGLVVPGQGDPAQRTFSDLLWQAGGEWVDENNKPSFNAAAGIEALTFYRDLIQKYKVAPPDAVSYQWDENSSEFSSGAVFDTFDWPGSFATLANPATSKVVGKWSTAPYIRNKTRDLMRGLACDGAQQPVQEEGRGDRVHQVLCRPRRAALDFQEFTDFPSRQSVAKQVVAAAQGEQAAWLGQLEQTIATGKEWPKLPGFSKVCTIMYTAIEKALSNQASPADCAEPGGQGSAGGDDAGGGLPVGWRHVRGAAGSQRRRCRGR